jgi:hypothetical protein
MGGAMSDTAVPPDYMEWRARYFNSMYSSIEAAAMAITGLSRTFRHGDNFALKDEEITARIISLVRHGVKPNGE